MSIEDPDFSVVPQIAYHITTPDGKKNIVFEASQTEGLPPGTQIVEEPHFLMEFDSPPSPAHGARLLDREKAEWLGKKLTEQRYEIERQWNRKETEIYAEMEKRFPTKPKQTQGIER